MIGKNYNDKDGATHMAEFKYEITQRIAVLSQNPNGWERQLNLVSWNEREPKYDLRDWAPDNAKMGKGISLTLGELLTLRDLLNELELEDIPDELGS